MKPLQYRYECSRGHKVVSERRDLCGDDETVPCPAMFGDTPCWGEIGFPFVYVDDLDRAGIDLGHTYKFHHEDDFGSMLYERRPLDGEG